MKNILVTGGTSFIGKHCIAQLIEKGYDAYIQKSKINNNNVWYRVRIGSYDNYNLASLAARDISSALNMPTWIDFIRREE